MLEKIATVRDIIIKTYQKIRFIVNPVIKFFVAWLIFSRINNTIGYDPRLTGSTICILLAAICAVLPPSVTVFLAMVLSLLHIYSVSIFLAAVVAVVFLILYALLLRFTPRESIVVLLIPFLAHYNMHYAVPMVLGSIYNPLMILPCSCGIIVKYMIDLVQKAAKREVTKSLDDIIQFYTDVADAFIQNKAMYVMIIVFAIVIIVIYIIRKLSFEYSLPISIGAGMVTNIVVFLLAELKVGTVVNIGSLIRMSLLAGIVAYVVEFMHRVLDYTAIERLQFEDEDYYYYVKAIPKVKGAFSKGYTSREIDDAEYEEDFEEEEIEQRREQTDEEIEEELDELEEEEASRDVPDTSEPIDFAERLARRASQISFDEDKEDTPETFEEDLLLDDEDNGNNDDNDK